MFLSIIIPAYNESKRIERTLLEITNYLDSCNFKSEIIVSDDGSTDDTSAIVTRLIENNSMIRLLTLEHKGKGWAVRNGMVNSKAKYRFISDLDLSVSLTHIKDFVKSMKNGADLVIASRQLKGSQRLNEPKRRFLASRFFNQIIRCSLFLGVSDSQCGFKGFTADTANTIFSVQCLNGYCFDPEVLFIAKKMNYTVIERPVIWTHQAASKINLKVDSIKMLWDLFRIRIYSMTGKYTQRNK